MYILPFWDNYCDQKVKNQPLFFSLVFAGIGGKRTCAKDQKQTIYFKRPKLRMYCIVRAIPFEILRRRGWKKIWGGVGFPKMQLSLDFCFKLTK